ncbi:MAG: hypothetical protein Q9166_004315 [cf. Caloplaca sp. 2 TL-2023]
MHFSTKSSLLFGALITFPPTIFAAADPSPPTENTTHALLPRYDYEPGDTLNRTMCFCTTDTSLQQVSSDPYAFYNSTIDHEIGFVYQYHYYNHRLDVPFVLTAFNNCHTQDSPQDTYYHNRCLDWEHQSADFCAMFDISDRELPEGLSWTGRFVEFCYGMRGDTLDGGEEMVKDWFAFDRGKRDLPRRRDWLQPREVVRERCRGLCESTHGMELFESRFGGWFNRMDGFQHFDDICTKNMNCKAGPGRVDPKHPPP